MIARPKISRNEWKPAERGAFEVGNFALLSCPGDGADLGDLVRAYAADFACLRRFPGDERVRSQSSLLQAAARGGKAGFAHFKVFRYEALMANAAAPSNATGAKKRTERIEAVAKPEPSFLPRADYVRAMFGSLV